MRHLLLSITLCLLLSASLIAQELVCPDWQAAAATVIDACTTLVPNQVCYGQGSLTTTPQAWAESETFAQGISLNTVQLKSLTLEANTDAPSIAILKLALPTAHDTPITLVVFGEATLIWSDQPEPVFVEITSTSNGNIRSGAGTQYAALGKFVTGQTALADARNPAGDWLRFTLPDSTDTGWIYVPLVKASSDVLALPIVDDAAAKPALTMLQDFTFTTPANPVDCRAHGILIQTPPDLGLVEFRINEQTVYIGSTVLLAAADDQLRLAVLEGQSIFIAPETATVVPAGAQINVSASDVEFVPYTPDEVAALPTDMLTPIEIAAPISAAAFADRQTIPLTGTWQPEMPFTKGAGIAGCGVSAGGGDMPSRQITVAEDGSSWSGVDPIGGAYTVQRIEAGVYRNRDVDHHVIHPLFMTATYDVDATPGCVLMVTQTMTWLHP